MDANTGHTNGPGAVACRTADSVPRMMADRCVRLQCSTRCQCQHYFMSASVGQGLLLTGRQADSS